VLKSYFSGAPPFRQHKCREDIPDAFFLEAVRDVVTELQQAHKRRANVHVVTSDNGLGIACQALPGVIRHTTLDEFTNCDDFKGHEHEHELEVRVELLKLHIRSYEVELRNRVIETIKDELPWLSFPDTHFRSVPVPLTVEAIRAIDETTIAFDKVGLNSVDTIVIPFCCIISVDAAYTVASDVYRSMVDVEVREFEDRRLGGGLGDCLRSRVELRIRVAGRMSLTFEFASKQVSNPDGDFGEDITAALGSLESIDELSVLERL
jgi:hypothetical protein